MNHHHLAPEVNAQQEDHLPHNHLEQPDVDHNQHGEIPQRDPPQNDGDIHQEETGDDSGGEEEEQPSDTSNGDDKPPFHLLQPRQLRRGDIVVRFSELALAVTWTKAVLKTRYSKHSSSWTFTDTDGVDRQAYFKPLAPWGILTGDNIDLDLDSVSIVYPIQAGLRFPNLMVSQIHLSV